MRRYLLSLLVILSFAAVPAKAQDRAVDDAEGAKTFAQELGNQTVAIINDNESSSKDRSDNFRALFEESTNLDVVTRSLLGRHYRKVRAQKLVPAYKEAVTNYILSEFEENIQLVGIESLEVTGTRPAPGPRGEIFVRTNIDVTEGDDIIADWRLMKKDGKFQIINLEVLGYNFIVTGRTLFADRISALGYQGHIDELSEKYKDKYSND